MKLSAVIITYNEERNIERCLTSLQGVADEIVVIDSFSKDKTEEICKSFGVTFIQNPFDGHIQQKNFAIQSATHDWILSLDADELLAPELQDSIAEVKVNQEFNGYKMSRLTNYCGYWVKHCGWYPDTKTRLINRNFGKWEGVNPHDRLDLKKGESVGFLKGDILHYSYYTQEDHLKQIEYFGDIAANELFQSGGKSNWLKITVKTTAQFIKSFILKKGILDGTTGFTISRLSAYATYRKYYKLLKLQKR
ncbi:MAG: glycosyltransferase family 2 protein [Crocinitomicaceae bacterium]|jgi:glycosyltransferase involved in cell wall biosynthesis|nr:glycosyltransferase family 2 protein [Crocinitomicaceae bacterium]MDG2465223.1 glycosyltransferase family 2 protein [Crocinitomicaceae bacterium]